MYTAIRVPPVDGHGVRVKKLLEAGVANYETLSRLEKDALKALRDFDKDQLSLEQTLELLLAYDDMIEINSDGTLDPAAAHKRHNKYAQLYKEILEDKPWKSCDCTICNEIGIEVMIFRGNNRNRRRGFHNTYAFYKRFKELEL